MSAARKRPAPANPSSPIEAVGPPDRGSRKVVVATPGGAKPRAGRSRARTATSGFGVSGRVGHDSGAYYARRRPPVLSEDTTLNPCTAAGRVICGDARSMTEVPDNSVGLVVTSPPYAVGKEYGSAGDFEGGYEQYLGMLEEVFVECRRVLEPGGRMAVNVANLGRRPYISLSADVIVLLRRLGLFHRGEIVWVKGAGASGSCAWGSWRSPANPTLRDLSERVEVTSKGRFGRVLSPAQRQAAGLPHRSDISAEEFMSSTLDVWYIQAESARRVGHPAPFPIELASRLIKLYSYVGDVVLDPFVGSGTTLVAAEAAGRRWVGYDLDAGYVAAAAARVARAVQGPDTVSG